MIATPKPRKHKVTPKHQEMFLTMLPSITRVARQAFSDRDPEAREEAAAEVVAHAYLMFVGLVERGKEALAYPSVLAMFGVKRVRIGRQAATPQNVRDVSSMFCQLQKRIAVERLDRYDREDKAWHEILVEDHRAGPAETAAARIDVGNWFKSLTPRDRKIANFQAAGNATGETAERFGVSAGRISQLRRKFMESWEGFQGECSVHDIAAAAA
jgi:hypothetical protein